MSACRATTSIQCGSSIGQALNGVEHCQRVAWFRAFAKGVAEDLADLAGAIELHQGSIDQQTKIAIAALQRQSVGLLREMLVGQPELVGCSAAGGEIEQYRLVREVSRDLLLFQLQFEFVPAGNAE